MCNEKQSKKQSLAVMFALYCQKKHKSKELCTACKELLQYAYCRIEKCPFIESRRPCSACRVHCYAPKMRQQIKDVMRFSGPRMLWYHPKIALSHLYYVLKEKQK